MAAPDTRLPEGTDSIIDDSGLPLRDDAAFTPAVPLPADGGSLREKAGGVAQALRDQATEKTADLRGQATDRARDFAIQGKDRATSALDSISQLIADAAAQVDDKVGREYGDYARRAQEAVDGLAQALRDKDVDTLFADARDLVRRSPGLAVGAAAVVGFALVRVIKAGLDPAPAGDATAADPVHGTKDRG